MIEANGLQVPMQLEELLHPERSALLVYDMQAGICSQIEAGGYIVSQCGRLLKAARAAKLRVVYSRHLSNPAAWMGVTQYRTAMAWQKTQDPAAVKSWFLRDAPASRIVPELAPAPDDLVIEKFSMSAFEGTGLSFAMRDCRLTGLVICGIALEIGIEPTVRHATDLGVVPIVIHDACGSGNPEAGKRSLEVLQFIGEALISDVEATCRLLTARVA